MVCMPVRFTAALSCVAAARPSSCASRVRDICGDANYRGKISSNTPRYGQFSAWHRQWEQRCATPVRTAYHLANNSLLAPSTLERERVPASFAGEGRRKTEWWFQPAVLERALASRAGCLVYAFGVQHHDEFAFFHAAQGCQVFAFDPTVNHSTAWKPNITFHPWGLRSAAYGDDEVATIGQYGTVFGALLTLREIMERLGHAAGDTIITALKLDCEGCEFATFEELFCESPLTPAEQQQLAARAQASTASTHRGQHQHDAGADGRNAAPFAPRIVSISIELHFWVAQRMQYSADVERIRYAGLWLPSLGYKTFSFQRHQGALIPWRGEAAFVHPDLVAAGIDRGTCCYMYSWVREDLLDAFSSQRAKA